MSRETNFKEKHPLLPVEGPPTLNQLYHVSWGWSHGIVGRCVSIDHVRKTVILRKPKAKTPFKNPVKWEDLRHTRKTQLRIITQKANENLNNNKGVNRPVVENAG